MTPKKNFVGCRNDANRIVYRGAKRLYMCADCEPRYEGSGGIKPYATDVAGQAAPEGHHTGPAKRCGDRTGESEDES